MTRIYLVAIAGLAGSFFGLQPVQAYQAPWCAVIELGPGSMYWDCRCSLVRRLLPQRQYFGRQSWLLQCEPVLCRQRCGRPALSETPRSPAIAAAPDMSLMSASGT